MSALKDQDPDYGPSVATNEKHRRLYEENARNSTARKITAIVEKEFSQEIANKEREILEIQERLHKTLKTLHLLRYVVVADFYGRKQCQNIPVGEAKQTQIHPAIKELIGKSPKACDVPSLPSTSAEDNSLPSPTDAPVTDVTIEARLQEKDAADVQKPREKRKNEGEEARPKKIPRYIPPKSGMPESPDPSRNARHKVRKRIIVGNISKWIPPDWREDAASHKWTMYVRGDKGNPDIDDFVTKVRFFLHPSYRPNDVVEVTAAPFCLSRRGWGEFPVRVQLHFKSTFDKPMDIIHHLKLDRTYTGLQTLGSETVVDIWICGESKQFKRNIKVEENVPDIEREKKSCVESVVKTEPIDTAFTVKSEPIDNDSNLNSPDEPAYSLHAESNGNILDEETVTEHDKVLVIQRLRFCVQFDHDYIGAKHTVNMEENNLTIKHSLSPQSSSAIKAENSNKVDDTSRENVKDPNCSYIPSIDLKEKFPRTQKTDFVTSDNSSLFRKQGKYMVNNCSDRIILGPSTKVQESTLQPLQISIPPLFDTSGSKRVLVVQNDKTIPIDISSSKPRTSFNGFITGSKVKLNFSQGRGLSLLKKRPILENGTETGSSSKTNNNPVNAANLKIKPSATLLLNVSSNVPTLKIVETTCPSSVGADASAQNRMSIKPEELLELTSKNKITLGKDKHKIQSRKDIYEKELQSIKTARILDTLGLLRFIIRRLPIIAPEAADPDYRRLHPYACKSEEEFFEHNAAKRKALEWNRASMARQFLIQKGVPEDELWTVKEIVVWTQLHGYTPSRSHSISSASCNGAKELSKSSASTFEERHTISEPIEFQKWLRNHPDKSKNGPDDKSKEVNDDHEIIDIESEDSAEVIKNEKFNNGMDNIGCTSNDSKVTILELHKNQLPLYELITETTREIGIKLASEEIVPNVMHCAAGRVIMRAVECFVEDLVRGGLANACERDGDNPRIVALDDVRRAILNRREFDLLTNEGLGSNYRPSLMD